MYVIIGANGYLGSYIIRAVLRQTDENVLATARNIRELDVGSRLEWVECDVENQESVNRLVERLKKEDNLKIVYLAAYHHPDKVEQNPEYAWNINVTCLSRFVNAVHFAKALFYSSTDSVYGNSVDNYHFKETDALRPVNRYGHNKCAAEAVVVHSGFNVVRFPFLISPSLVKKKHFYDVIVDSLREGKPFEMYKDSYRSSLSFENAADLLVRVIESGKAPSVLNICGDDDLSKYDVGLMIADRCGCPRELIVPISIEKAKNNFETARAQSTLMSNWELKKLLHLKRVNIFQKPEECEE